MKAVFKFIITKVLAFKAKWYLWKNKVEIIAITGSVGKTTTKQAVHHLLQSRFNVYASPKGFNTELGMSLAILQQEASGFSSFSAWFKILIDIFFSKKEPYKKIILEMGADQPGDIARLVKIAPPSIGVVTAVHSVHVNEGQFDGLEVIAKEKNELIKKMKKTGVAILNADNEWVAKMQTSARVFKYGTSSDFDLYASHIKVLPDGIEFKAHYQSEVVDFKVPVLGDFQIYPLLGALSVALQLKMTLSDCAKFLADFKLPPGRMNPIDGINNSLILDGSYNASPVSVHGALDLLFQLDAKRRIVALGTMNELGKLSREEHLKVGLKAARAHLLIAVGPEAATLKQGAMEGGMSESLIYTFLDSVEAGHFLKDQIKEEDLILVKGSQNHVRMERLIEVIMKYPHQASTLLCRQESSWKNK